MPDTLTSTHPAGSLVSLDASFQASTLLALARSQLFADRHTAVTDSLKHALPGERVEHTLMSGKDLALISSQRQGHKLSQAYPRQPHPLWPTGTCDLSAPGTPRLRSAPASQPHRTSTPPPCSPEGGIGLRGERARSVVNRPRLSARDRRRVTTGAGWEGMRGAEVGWVCLCQSLQRGQNLGMDAADRSNLCSRVPNPATGPNPDTALKHGAHSRTLHTLGCKPGRPCLDASPFVTHRVTPPKGIPGMRLHVHPTHRLVGRLLRQTPPSLMLGPEPIEAGHKAPKRRQSARICQECDRSSRGRLVACLTPCKRASRALSQQACCCSNGPPPPRQ